MVRVNFIALRPKDQSREHTKETGLMARSMALAYIRTIWVSKEEGNGNKANSNVGLIEIITDF